MKKIEGLRKAKQAGRRAVREHIKGIELEYVVATYFKDKPKHLPQFIRDYILRLVLNKNAF